MIFKYKAYSSLLKELGRADYVVEITELAVRDFLNNLQLAQNPRNYISSKCNQYKVMVSYDQANNYYNQLTLGHIANVYHIAESFFYEFQIEYNEITNANWKFHQGETKLDQIIKFFSGKNRFNTVDKIDPYLKDTFSYYHQLRVFFSHKKTVSQGEINNKYLSASRHYDQKLLDIYKISEGPKKIEQLDFEDFFLFTRITKDICLQISSLCYPDAEHFAKNVNVQKLKKYTTNIHCKIETYLRTYYGFVKQRDSDNFVQEIIDSI